jgi:hypothetical protein
VSDSCRRKNLFQLTCTYDSIDFGNILANIVAETLDQASGYD